MGLGMVAGLPRGGRARRLLVAAGAAAGAAVLLGGCDIAPPHMVFTVTTTVDGGDAVTNGICEMTPGAGDCSLRAAVDEANANTGYPTRIVIRVGTYVLTVAGSDDTNDGGDLDLNPANNQLILDATDAVIDANDADAALD